MCSATNAGWISVHYGPGSILSALHKWTPFNTHNNSMRKVLVLSPYSTCRNWGSWKWSHLARANKGSNGDVKLDLCGNKALKHKRHLLPQIPLWDGNEFILIGWAPEEADQTGPRTPRSLETGVRRRHICWLPAPAEQYWGRGPRLVLTGSRGHHGGQGVRFQLLQSKSSWVAPLRKRMLWVVSSLSLQVSHLTDFGQSHSWGVPTA